MERLFLECAIRAALLVAGTAMVLLLLRVKDAAARHKVWAGVVVAMLVLPAWTAWGPKAALRVLPPLPEKAPIAGTTPAIRDAAPDLQQFEMNLPAAAAPVAPSPRWTWPTILLGIYLLGVAALLLRLAIGIVRAQRLIRRAELRDGRLTSAACAAPVTVGWFRPRVILPEEWREWPQTKLNAVLTHEGEHARRRDPLIQGFALLNRAAFWFHPAAWWLERRIATLAEEACDDVVLSRGHSPSDYSEYLMDMARAVMRSGARVNIVGVAMPGSSLPRRIKRIIEGVQPSTVSRARMACVAALCAITCTAFAAGTLDHALVGDPMRAPQQAAGGVPVPGTSLPSFESASIWRHAGGNSSRFFYSSGRPTVVTAIDITLRGLIRWAYPLRVAQDRIISGPPDQSDTMLNLSAPDFVSITGAPNWMDSEHFDIEAKAPNTADAKQTHLMLQSLLAERFNLAVHYNTEVVPVYALEVATAGRLGPQLRAHVSDGACWDPAAEQPPSSVTGIPTLPFCGGFRIVGPNNSIPENRRGVSMAGVAAYLTGRLDRPVLDRTGLSGSYDFDLVIEHKPTPDFAKLFGAVQQQLGLRLVPTNGPIEVFVIDSVEWPMMDSPKQAQAPPTAPAGAPASSQVVDSIIFDGNRRIGSQELAPRIFLRPGDRYSDEALRRDYMALWNSQLFDNIRMEVQDSPNRANGKIVIFHLVERPVIRQIQYQGFAPIQASNLEDRLKNSELEIVTESPLDRGKIERAAALLKALLAENGRPSAVVSTRIEVIPGTNAVRLTITAAESPAAAGQQLTPTIAQGSPAAPTLQPSSRVPINLMVNTDSRRVFEAVGSISGFTITFGPNFASRQIMVDLSNVTAEKALDVISLQANASWKPLTNTSIYVTSAQAAAQGQARGQANVANPSRQEDVAVSLGLVIDNSGGMRDKRTQMNTAALTFVQAINPSDEAFVVDFNGDYYFDPVSDFTNDINDLRGALRRIDSGGETALYDAVVGSLDHLQKGRNKKVLLIITDGMDNASQHSLEDAVRAAQRSGAIIYAIGVFSDNDLNQIPDQMSRARGALDQITKATGGMAFFPDRAVDTETLATQIARDIRNQ